MAMPVEKGSLLCQYHFEVGALNEAGRILLRQGEIKFGKPTEKVKAAIKEEDLSRLRRMAVSVLTATSWDEVLDTP
jgi:hypothetical protein